MPLEPEAPWGSGAPAQPESSGAPAQPESRGAPAQPESRGAPAQPESRGAPAQPESSGAPAQPESRGAPAQPESSGAPAQPESRGTRATMTCFMPESVLIYLSSPKFLIYVSGALSMWGDRMWHFAISVFLVELYGRNLLLTAVFGLVVASSVLLFGALIGDWVDRHPRDKVAHASLFIQNISVTVSSIVLMLVFSYKHWIERICSGWLTVVCYTLVIILADVANLASTALTIAIQRDWIVVITGCDRARLAEVNATMRRIDQVTNILAPLAVGQVMTLASNVAGCGFILGWNLVSLIVEFIFLSRVYRIVPMLAVKAQPGKAEGLGRSSCVEPQVSGAPGGLEQNCRSGLHSKEMGKSPLCIWRFRQLLRTWRDGWKAYYRQPVFLAGMGLAFLYTTVLGFDCITTGYAYTQGISGSLLSLLMGVSAVTGLAGTVIFTRLRKAYGLLDTGLISSCLHLSCLTLCFCSIFAPGSPMDLSRLGHLTGANTEGLGGQGKRHSYPFLGSNNQPLLPDRSSIHWTNSTVLFQNFPTGSAPESYISIILLFVGVITARVGLWSFDLTVTQLLQESISESERGVVNGVQSSINYLMDLLHFVMVICAPQPQHFGILVIISVLFIAAGHAMYLTYVRKAKKTQQIDTDCCPGPADGLTASSPPCIRIVNIQGSRLFY